MQIAQRPRRNRNCKAIRAMVCETILTPHDLVYPLFVTDGKGVKQEIASMPGCFRLSLDQLLLCAREVHSLGIQAVALFPHIADSLKDEFARESSNDNGLLQTTVRALKDAIPELLVITDVAMDPYSSTGHDGYVKDGRILNDETLDILADMAVSQAKAGADIVAPSDMMDGRVGFIRRALDENSFSDVGILSYAVKYASAMYGPFRDALDSAPRGGDKKTYQMNPANVREASREVQLDVSEGADIVMVKPALSYLDVISAVRREVDVPVAAYNVSGEYAMVKAAEKLGWGNGEALMMEILLSIKRAGADMIFTYHAMEAARFLNK